MKSDIFHDNVIKALEKDKWKITDDPLTLSLGIRSIFVDLGAEKVIGATKNNKRIAVEIKSFLGQSLLVELEKTLGQYDIYKFSLDQQDPERILYLAISAQIYSLLQSEPVLLKILEIKKMNLLIFNSELDEVSLWLPLP